MQRLLTQDGDERYAFAVVVDGEQGPEGIAIGRFARADRTGETAEIAITVLDAYQRHGLGRLLLDRLQRAAKSSRLCPRARRRARRKPRDARAFAKCDPEPAHEAGRDGGDRGVGVWRGGRGESARTRRRALENRVVQSLVDRCLRLGCQLCPRPRRTSGRRRRLRNARVRRRRAHRRGLAVSKIRLPDEPRLPAVGFSLPGLVALSQFARSRRGALQALAQPGVELVGAAIARDRAWTARGTAAAHAGVTAASRIANVFCSQSIRASAP